MRKPYLESQRFFPFEEPFQNTDGMTKDNTSNRIKVTYIDFDASQCIALSS